MPQLVELNSVLNDARDFVQRVTIQTHDVASDEKSMQCDFERYLLTVAKSLFLLIQELETRPSQETSFLQLTDARALFGLISQQITGIEFTLPFFLSISGVANDEREAAFCVESILRQREIATVIEKPKVPVLMLGIVGPISSGKGTVGAFFEKYFGTEHYPLSNRLRDVSLTIHHDEKFPRDKMRQVNDLMKTAHGNDVFVRWTMDTAQRQANRRGLTLATIDGFRGVDEALTFKREGGVLVGVQAKQKNRFKRLVSRGRYGDDGWESFLESDAIESAWIEPIFEICDHIINNDGTEKRMLQRLIRVFDKIVATYPN
jgi:dephospho-CoA kinase